MAAMLGRCLTLSLVHRTVLVWAQNHSYQHKHKRSNGNSHKIHNRDLIQNRSGACFIDSVWGSNEITVKKDIVYGSAYNPAWKKNQTLRLDAYFPPETDNRTLRPAIVLVHGGFFEFGSKSSDNEPKFAMKMVERGFVAVSIDYRLLAKHFGQSNNQTILAATEDARAAVRFVRKMATEWRIDSSRIAVGGDSAGAVVALFLGFVKDAQHDGYSGNPGYSSAVNASISVSGELKPEANCEKVHPKPHECQLHPQKGMRDATTDINGSPGQPPVVIVHGTEDHTVPFVNGEAVYKRAEHVGIKAELISIQGGGHIPFNAFFNKGSHFQDFMKFLVDAMDLNAAQCPKRKDTSLETLFV
eukprot:gnl/MRDRNA2_/MRDRNA2_134206_c0_seq1.p1 gnl/MRDRNA2_/MRDRNA2_134206_c0~~gnl/MRDRNA2_/MRDRNA2_134206_c0_seq1.p1  ORF type:complete len:370 (+),score=51.72 gnl/MRDRNA2_/MRDRNA2_134206_c0_seq1:41-1111(+)